MALLQGNTYYLPIEITNCDDEVLTANDIVKAQFVVGNVEKFYGDGGTVGFDDENNVFLIPLTEEETFAMKGMIKWQVRVVYNDGTIEGTVPTTENVYLSITTTRLTPSQNND